jgi:putative membrane protein insertion efficiency factor
MNPAQHFLTLVLRGYRGVVSPLLTAVFGPMGFGCRYSPTCSRYALEAVRLHGAARGSWLAAKRVCRCHPWGGCGDDPVPPASNLHDVSNITACRNGS